MTDITHAIMDITQAIMDITQAIMDTTDAIMNITEAIMDITEAIIDITRDIIDITYSARISKNVVRGKGIEIGYFFNAHPSFMGDTICIPLNTICTPLKGG